MIALRQNIHNVTRSIFEYLKFDDQSKYCFKTISNKMEFYQCLTVNFIFDIHISRKFLNCASYLVFILIIKLTIMILSGIACDAITNKYCFFASNENVLFTSRSASNIVNGIAFLKLQNFVSVLYVILINFKKCNKRADNFCIKTCLGSLSVLHF